MKSINTTIHLYRTASSYTDCGYDLTATLYEGLNGEYTLLDSVGVVFTYDEAEAIQKELAAIDSEEKRIQTEAFVKCQQLKDRREKLLCITHQPLEGDAA